MKRERASSEEKTDSERKTERKGGKRREKRGKKRREREREREKEHPLRALEGVPARPMLAARKEERWEGMETNNTHHCVSK
jgi:hypothetical protein